MKIIAIGGNLPIKENLSLYEGLQLPFEILKKEYGCDITHISSWYHTKAWPDPQDPQYLNAVFAVKPVENHPEEFMKILHDIELRFGRVRSERNAPRTLDLDIILWDDYISTQTDTEKGLSIPHPRALGRIFVLKPLSDIMEKDYIFPHTKRSLQDHISEISYDETDISLYEG